MTDDRTDPNAEAARASDQRRRGGRPCPRCEAALYRRHCKYVCPNHGVIYDCSDPF